MDVTVEWAEPNNGNVIRWLTQVFDIYQQALDATADIFLPTISTFTKTSMAWTFRGFQSNEAREMLTGMMNDATTVMIEDILESHPIAPSTYWYETCWLDEDDHSPKWAHDSKEAGMTVADNTVKCLGNLMIDVTHEIREDIHQNGRPATELPAEAARYLTTDRPSGRLTKVLPGSRWVVVDDDNKASDKPQSTPTEDEIVIVQGWMDANMKEDDIPKFDAGWFKNTATLPSVLKKATRNPQHHIMKFPTDGNGYSIGGTGRLRAIPRL